MARVNGPAQQVHEELTIAGIELSASQVARSMIDQLGPLDDAADPLEHWRALSALRAGKSQRLPEADIAAMELAVELLPCARLRDAILRLSDTVPPTTDEVERARQLAADRRSLEVERSIAEAILPGDAREKSYGAQLARRFVEGSIAAGPVLARSEPSAEDVELEHIGRAQAAMDELAEKLDGTPTAECIDIDDLATVTQFPTDSVAVALQHFDAALGNDWLAGGTRAVQMADLHVLAAAVRSANAVMPLFERVAFHVGDGRLRWQVAAICVPALLALAGLVTESNGDDRSALLEMSARIAQVTSFIAMQAGPLASETQGREPTSN